MSLRNLTYRQLRKKEGNWRGGRTSNAFTDRWRPNVNRQMESAFVEEFIKLGCATRKEAVVAVHVYLELCEVKKYWDVEYHFSADLKCMYITAKRTKSSAASVFVPIPASDGVSFDDMRKYLVLDRPGNKSVHLAIVDSDSTCVYYQITDGIAKPIPETRERTLEDRRARLDGELGRHGKALERAALYGMPITIAKKQSLR